MFSEEQYKKKVQTTAAGLPVGATGIPLEGPTVVSQGLPAGLTPGLEFKKVEHQTIVESGGLPATGVAAVPPIASTGQLPAATFASIPPAAQGIVQGGVMPPLGTHQTFVEKIPVTETQATEFRRKSLEGSTVSTGAPLGTGFASTTALPATGLAAPVAGAAVLGAAAIPPPGTHQTFVEKIPATSGLATTSAVPPATAVAATTTAATAAPVLTYTGIQYDIPCYIFSWSDDLHIEIPKVAKKAIGTSRSTTGAVSVINEAVYAHKGRHLPGRKRRQRWIFSKEGFITSEYNPDFVLTCFNNTVTVQRREAIATSLPAATLGAPAAPLSSTGLCQQWILKPSTDSNYFYICCAKNPSLAVDIEKTGELIHKGYPLVVRPLGNLSTAWSYDPK